MTSTLDIRAGDLDDPRVRELLAVHVARARAESPPESAHALEVDGLKGPLISFFAAFTEDTLVAVGALKRLSPTHAELKSMHTAERMRGYGYGSAMCRHLIDVARSRGYARLSLETGTMAYFEPARALYAKHGFIPASRSRTTSSIRTARSSRWF